MAQFVRCCRKCSQALVVRTSARGTSVSCGCRALLAVVNDNGREPPTPSSPVAYAAAVQVEVGTPVLALAA